MRKRPDSIDASVARALRATQPALYAVLVELVRRGHTKAEIMERVNAVAPDSLTASAIDLTLDYLIKQEKHQ